MSTMSFVFFGMMLIPFVLFLIWLVKQDKKKNYIGLTILAAAIIIAAYVAINVDLKFMSPQQGELRLSIKKGVYIFVWKIALKGATVLGQKYIHLFY